MSDLPHVRLRRGREGPALGRHPWVFSGAVASVSGEPADGAEVVVEAHDGRPVGRGLFNARSQIRIRLYRWDGGPLDADFFRERVNAAVDLRERLGLLDPERACRVVFSEGDGLSGLIVDRYATHLAVQLTALGLHQRQNILLDALQERLAPEGIVLRTQKGVREEEGLDQEDGWIRGNPLESPIEVDEDGLVFGVDLRTGHKTGTYLDQRLNHGRVVPWARGLEVADVCCYAGGFTLAMLRGGAASVVGVDVSAAALALARENLRINGLEGASADLVQADAFKWLEEARSEGRTFDMVVLDPPRFAQASRGVPGALRGYRRLNDLAVDCLRPGGILVTCSCTGRVSRSDLRGVLAQVSARSGRHIRILDSLSQPPDHPVSPSCPETAYLKGFICTVA